MTDPCCAGTIDKVAPSACANEDGSCDWGLGAVDHYFSDVVDFQINPIMYNEIQCCLRAVGVASGTTHRGDGTSDESLREIYQRCWGHVFYGKKFCGKDLAKDC